MADTAPNMHPLARPRRGGSVAGEPARGLESAAGVRLLAAGRYEMHDHRPGGAKTQSTWLVELLLRGELQVRVQDRPWRSYRRGSGLLYAPHTPYRERTTRRGAVCESVALLFEVGPASPLEHWARLQPSFRQLDDPEEQLTQLAEQVLRHFGTGAAGDLLARGCFLQLLGRLLQSETPGETWSVTTGQPDHDLVSRTHRFMRANLARPLLLSDLAREVGLTESGFAHAYKRLTGDSPMAALRRRRVEAVTFYLYSNRYTLTEIAHLTGFTDAFHLSRTFKQHVGVSPRDFRKQIGR